MMRLSLDAITSPARFAAADIAGEGDPEDDRLTNMPRVIRPASPSPSNSIVPTEKPAARATARIASVRMFFFVRISSFMLPPVVPIGERVKGNGTGAKGNLLTAKRAVRSQ
jgi:hypothetical protein